MDYMLLVLRVVHVVGGIVWVGSAVMMNNFVGPAINAAQDAGQQVMRQLITKTRFSAAMTGSAVLTVLAGGALMGRAAGAGSAWFSSGPGIGFSLGAAFALVGFVCGMLIGMSSAKLARLGSEIQGKPTADQAARLAALQKRLNMLGPVNVYALMISAILMAVARYLVF